MSPEIFNGISKALKHPPNRTVITGALGLRTSLNEMDSRAVFLLLLKINPASSPQQREHAILILQHLARLDVFNNHGEHAALMKSKIDEILLQAPGTCKL